MDAFIMECGYGTLTKYEYRLRCKSLIKELLLQQLKKEGQIRLEIIKKFV